MSRLSLLPSAPAQPPAPDGGRWPSLACRLLPTLEDPEALDRYIAASQVGITLSSLILGAYGQAVLAPRLAPLLVAWFNLPSRRGRLHGGDLAVLLSLTVLAHGARRARAEVARAAGSRRRRRS